MMKHICILLVLISAIVNGYAQHDAPLQFGNKDYYVKWMSPNNMKKEVGKHEKMELGVILLNNVNNEIAKFIKTSKDGLNPFDPEDISIEATFVSPTNNEKKIFGFYYQPHKRNGETWRIDPVKYNWRIRFAPDEIGVWKMSIKIIVKDKIHQSIGVKFHCVASEQKGIVTLKKSNRYIYLSESDQPFFTIGHNIAHSAYYKLTPKKAEQHKLWLTELAENGGNFFRLEMGAQNALPDWNDYKNYATKMPQMGEFDGLIEHAQGLGLYFILFRHHTEVCTGEDWEVAKWSNNPYKLGFGLKNRTGYFTNEQVIKWQKNALRYIFSRWGYSTSFAFYEYQELDNWVKGLKRETGYNTQEAIALFSKWYVGQQKYIKEELSYDKLFINTYATTPGFEYKPKNKGMFAHSDLIGFHKYGQNKDINYNDKYDKAVALWENWKKPLFIEEMGVDAYGKNNYLPIYKCSNAAFHNSIWSTSFMGGAGTGMIWWWDRGVHDFEHYKDYKPLAAFFKDERLDSKEYIPQKWHSKLSIKRALIENYALVSEDGYVAIGWVHNATHYWRNIKSPCLEELTSAGQFKTPHKLKDGYSIGGKGAERTDFTKKSDAYTKKGIQDVSGQTFEIKGLKSSSLFGKSNWYEMIYYSTVSGEKISTEFYKATIWGKLKPKYPNVDESDFSYKIKYVGELSKEQK